MTLTSDDRRVYLDYAATAPLRPAARKAMEALLSGELSGVLDGAGNANALHSAGRAAFATLEKARGEIACAIGAERASEVVFTAGATEADNAALIGIALGARSRRKPSTENAVVVLSALEHDAVRKTAEILRDLGFSVKELRPNGEGFIEVRELERVIDDQTVLVSVQMANAEIGAIQPVTMLAEIAHEHGALFHSDGVQALGKTPVNVERMGCDAATFSSHKVGGPYGIGALYLRRSVPFKPIIVGGGQENGRRSGTQNVVGAVGFAAALKDALAHQEQESLRLRGLRDRLYEALAVMPSIEATVDVEAGSEDFLPSIANFIFLGYESETLVLRYDALGFEVSGGSACASTSLEPSYALRAMGIAAKRALGELRLSMGESTTAEDIDAFIAATPKVLQWH